jgi:hypothetical protein
MPAASSHSGKANRIVSPADRYAEAPMSELERADLLAKYDEQLRTDAPSAVAVAFLGPLHLVSFPWGQGWVTYRDFSGADGATIRRWVGEVLDHFRSDPAIRSVKWKARGHDEAPGLHEALLDHGFTPGEPESVMIGPARTLAVDVALPEGIVLRRIRDESDVRRLAQMQHEVFGDVDVDGMTVALLHRQSLDDGMELWVAEHEGRVVGKIDVALHSPPRGAQPRADLPQFVRHPVTTLLADSARLLAEILTPGDGGRMNESRMNESRWTRAA